VNIYEEIDKLFEEDDKLDKILKKLDEEAKERKREKEFLTFKKTFISRYKENPKDGFFPEFDYKGRTLGINYKGFLYYKDNKKILSPSKAQKVFEYLFFSKLVIKNIEYF